MDIPQQAIDMLADAIFKAIKKEQEEKNHE